MSRTADAVINWQVTAGPLAEIHDCFYRCRDFLIRQAFADYDASPLPMISLETDPNGKWRGKFQNVGPFGFANVITINVSRFKMASDATETFAHEMAHWFCSPLYVSSRDDMHGLHWRTIMEERLGLPVNEGGDRGIRASEPRWWELEAGLNTFGLERFILNR